MLLVIKELLFPRFCKNLSEKMKKHKDFKVY